ncbi:MAG: WhiB family transcriptional regulator [Mycobacterium sp.]
MNLPDGDNWETYAACKGMDTEIFFPPVGGNNGQRAKTICETRCPVKAQCLASVIHIGREADHGIFGGTSVTERVAIRQGAA